MLNNITMPDPDLTGFAAELQIVFELLSSLYEDAIDNTRDCEPDSRSERYEQVGELRDTAEELVKLLNQYIASAEYE